MFAKWFRKYVDVYKDNLMRNEEVNTIAKLYEVEAEQKFYAWFKNKNEFKCMWKYIKLIYAGDFIITRSV